MLLLELISALPLKADETGSTRLARHSKTLAQVSVPSIPKMIEPSIPHKHVFSTSCIIYTHCIIYWSKRRERYFVCPLPRHTVQSNNDAFMRLNKSNL